MNPGSLLFVVCALLCLVGALIVVLARNPIRGAMGLLTTIVGIAGLFLRLNAEFLATMQLLVYAGAVVILFVFVVMLVGTSAEVKGKSHGGALLGRAFSGALVVMIGIASAAAFSSGKWNEFQTIGKSHGSVEAVGRQMFTAALVPFELATVLLIVAVIGAISVARSKPNGARKAVEANPTLRMYHGPLHPRDAESPLTGEVLSARAAAESKNREAFS
jgi:NADH-quinone oxidoreductase subunit J